MPHRDDFQLRTTYFSAICRLLHVSLMLLSTEQPMLTQPPTIIAGQTILPACVLPFFCAVGNITTCCSLLWFLPDPSPLVCSARFLSCNISREREFYAAGLHCSYVLSLLCGTFCSPQHRDAGLPPLLWCSLMFVSRDSDIRMVQIHNNYLITVIPHTRILAACPHYKKCPSQTPSSRNLQSCHSTRHSTGAEHILSLISSEALCKMLGCFLLFFFCFSLHASVWLSEQRLQVYCWQEEAGTSQGRRRENSVLDSGFLFGLRGNGRSVGKQHGTAEPQMQLRRSFAAPGCSYSSIYWWSSVYFYFFVCPASVVLFKKYLQHVHDHHVLSSLVILREKNIRYSGKCLFDSLTHHLNSCKVYFQLSIE